VVEPWVPHIPDLLQEALTEDRVCGFHWGKPHEVQWLRLITQENRAEVGHPGFHYA
jgi:hypothetical protein